MTKDRKRNKNINIFGLEKFFELKKDYLMLQDVNSEISIAPHRLNPFKVRILNPINLHHIILKSFVYELKIIIFLMKGNTNRAKIHFYQIKSITKCFIYK